MDVLLPNYELNSSIGNQLFEIKLIFFQKYTFPNYHSIDIQFF